MAAFYVEVLFIGPSRARGIQAFEVNAREFETIRRSVLELEDGDAGHEVQTCFDAITKREPVSLATGDREAERVAGRLVSLEYR